MTSQVQQMEELLTFNEVVKYLRISRSTLWRWMQEEKIAAYKIGRSWRFYAKDVKALVNGAPTEQGEKP